MKEFEKIRADIKRIRISNRAQHVKIRSILGNLLDCVEELDQSINNICNVQQDVTVESNSVDGILVRLESVEKSIKEMFQAKADAKPAPKPKAKPKAKSKAKAKTEAKTETKPAKNAMSPELAKALGKDPA